MRKSRDINQEIRELSGSDWKNRVWVGLGATILALCSAFLFMAEKFHHDDSVVLDEVADNLIHLDSSGDPSVQGRLVYATGELVLDQNLNDHWLGIQFHAAAVEREVRYFQWVETERRENSRVVREYSRRWVDTPVRSDLFQQRERDRRRNFTIIDVNSARFASPAARLGAYQVPFDMLLTLGDAEPARFDQVGNGWLAALQQRLLPSAEPWRMRPLVHAGGNAIYFGQSPEQPEVGDVEVQYFLHPPGPVSIIAVADGGRFRPYRAENGEMFIRIQYGSVPVDAMLNSERSASAVSIIFCRCAFFLVALVMLRLTPMYSLTGRRKLYFPAAALTGAVMTVHRVIVYGLGGWGLFAALVTALLVWRSLANLRNNRAVPVPLA